MSRVSSAQQNASPGEPVRGGTAAAPCGETGARIRFTLAPSSLRLGPLHRADEAQSSTRDLRGVRARSSRLSFGAWASSDRSVSILRFGIIQHQISDPRNGFTRHDLPGGGAAAGGRAGADPAATPAPAPDPAGKPCIDSGLSLLSIFEPPMEIRQPPPRVFFFFFALAPLPQVVGGHQDGSGRGGLKSLDQGSRTGAAPGGSTPRWAHRERALTDRAALPPRKAPASFQPPRRNRGYESIYMLASLAAGNAADSCGHHVSVTVAHGGTTRYCILWRERHPGYRRVTRERRISIES